MNFKKFFKDSPTAPMDSLLSSSKPLFQYNKYILMKITQYQIEQNNSEAI